LSRIEKTNRPVANIAMELGYIETSAFFRAFVDWTGEAPTAYRKRLRSLQRAAQ
jgi:AraC-like DNA-binding protein